MHTPPHSTAAADHEPTNVHIDPEAPDEDFEEYLERLDAGWIDAQRQAELAARYASIASDDSEHEDCEYEFNEDDDTSIDPYDNLSDYDEDDESDDEFPWLNEITKTVTRLHLDPRKRKVVGSCKAKLIRRNQIRGSFYAEMDGPSHDTLQLAFQLFDRFGRLKTQYIKHPVKRGSGAWGRELDSCEILLIESIVVKRNFRRRGLGKQLVQRVLANAQKYSYSGHFITLTWPALLTSEVNKESLGCTEEEKQSIADAHLLAAKAFWRSIGFRRVGDSIWFGHHPTDSHPSHAIAAEEDFDPPRPASRLPLLEVHPTLQDIVTQDDAHFITYLTDTLGQVPPDDPRWFATGIGGNTLLHAVALESKPDLVKWMSQHNRSLLAQRNDDSQTPLEFLQQALENKRTQTQLFSTGEFELNHLVPIVLTSDTFTGFPRESARCLLILQDKDDQDELAIHRTIFGCTCEQCIDGFLSPRMRLALRCVAESIYNTMMKYVDRSGPRWALTNGSFFEYMPSRVYEDLVPSIPKRHGFANLFKYTSAALHAGLTPTRPNVLQILERANEQPPVSMEFLKMGGAKIDIVVKQIIATAIEQDEVTGNGKYNRTFGAEIDKLPACRNDHEFLFVQRQCGYDNTKPFENDQYSDEYDDLDDDNSDEDF